MVNYITRVDAKGEVQMICNDTDDSISFSMWSCATGVYGTTSPWIWLNEGLGDRLVRNEEIQSEFEDIEEYETHEINTALTFENATDSDTLLDIVLAFMKRTIENGHQWKIF